MLSFCIGANSQEPPKAVLVDEFGILCSEELMARYDYFVGKLATHPSSKGLLILYGDRTSEGRNLSLYQYVNSFYPQVRQFKNLNLEFVRGIDQAETKVQFWIIPAGAGDPRPIETYKPLPVTSTTRYELGCDFAPNNVGFVDLLKKNRSLTGFLVIYTEFGKGKSHGDRVAKFAINKLLKNFRISRTRIKTIYGGNRINPEIELWLVPDGHPLPELRPDREPTSN